MRVSIAGDYGIPLPGSSELTLTRPWKWLTLAANGLRGEAGDIAQRNIAVIEGADNKSNFVFSVIGVR